MASRPASWRINQRIGQAALRRAEALGSRLAAGLTGGDLRDGAITASKLAPGLFVVDTDDNAPTTAPTRTAEPPPARRRNGRVRVSDAQATVNLLISRAALRRAERLQRLVQRGLTGRNFRPGSIGVAQLSDELRAA